MHAKKGFELSINMIVVIVISLLIFGIGFFLVTSLVDDATKQVEKVDEQLMEQLRRTQFSDGKLVAILNPKESVRRGKSAYFLLGFVSKLSPPSYEFKVVSSYSTRSPIHTDFSSPSASNDVQKLFANKDSMLLYNSNDVALATNKEHFMWLSFPADKKLLPGDYYFDVTVCTNGVTDQLDPACPSSHEQRYGGKQRLFITVQ